jgi:hypothetical protein
MGVKRLRWPFPNATLHCVLGNWKACYNRVSDVQEDRCRLQNVGLQHLLLMYQ